MMKKIIELVERYFELDQNPPCKDNSKESAEAREKWADTIWNIEQEIGDRIARRRELEATPITEDWLEEHGFAQNEFRDYEYDLYLNDREDEIRYYRRGGERDSTMSIYRNIEMEDEVCYELPEPYTVAQMLDACELCGIKMED